MSSEMPETEIPGAGAEAAAEPIIASISTDAYLATALLIVVVMVVAVTIYMMTKKTSAPPSSWKQDAFTPPTEREEYIALKATTDLTDVKKLDELKKLLMRRTIKTIPILLSLQNEGSSIERLYKKGMLTDDMHFKVKELKAFADKEFQDIQMEADELLESWGPQIWQQAMQFHQMILKQAQAKVEEAETAVETKKKADKQKVKDKEKAKKAATSSAKEEAAAATAAATAEEEDYDEMPPLAEAEPLDPAAQKAQDAERMAAQLIEEEAQEQVPSKKSSAKKSKK